MGMSGARVPAGTRLRARASALAVLAAVAALAGVAPAQQKPLSRPPANRKAASPDAGAAAGRTPAPSQVVASSAGAGGAASDAGVVESRTLDGGTRVFKFKELDIEGRLKSPQLVYFLRRVRAEFGAEDLGHRTFLREMSETRKEPTF